MEKQIKVYQGADLPLGLKLYDGDTPVDLSKVTDVIMYLYQSSSTVIRVAKEGDGLQWSLVNDYELRVKIENSETKKWSVGDYTAEFKVKLPSAEWNDGVLDAITVQKCALEVKKSLVGTLE